MFSEDKLTFKCLCPFEISTGSDWIAKLEKYQNKGISNQNPFLSTYGGTEVAFDPKLSHFRTSIPRLVLLNMNYCVNYTSQQYEIFFLADHLRIFFKVSNVISFASLTLV